MRIISRRKLREFWENEKNAENTLDEWFKRIKKLSAQNLTELRLVFPQADLVGRFVVFNVGGNKYRLITKIDFQRQIVYTKHVLTHQEYDRNKWKADC